MILQDRDTVLFDLDGTLLPFRQEDFVHDYFGRLVRKAMPLGFDKDTLVLSLIHISPGEGGRAAAPG